MLEIRKTAIFDRWLRHLRDRTARQRIEVRLDRLRMGNAGDVRPVGDGVSELRVHYGPGYRVYFAQKGSNLVVLLCGGNKSDQADDIAQAKAMSREWET